MNRYWTKRLADKLFESNTTEMNKELRKRYKQAAKDMKSSVEGLYFKMLENGGELSTTELYKYGRYNQCLEELKRIIERLGGLEQAFLAKQLELAYKAAFNMTSSGLGKTISWGLQNQRVLEEVVNANFKGANFKTRINMNNSKFLKLLDKEITNCIASGQSKDTAIKNIMSRANSSFRDTDRLVRTETMRCINAGQLQSYKDNGYTHGYYLVAHDDRLCDYCNKRAMETKKNPEALTSLESVHHPNCRCTIIPVVD